MPIRERSGTVWDVLSAYTGTVLDLQVKSFLFDFFFECQYGNGLVFQSANTGTVGAHTGTVWDLPGSRSRLRVRVWGWGLGRPGQLPIDRQSV